MKHPAVLFIYFCVTGYKTNGLFMQGNKPCFKVMLFAAGLVFFLGGGGGGGFLTAFCQRFVVLLHKCFIVKTEIVFYVCVCVCGAYVCLSFCIILYVNCFGRTVLFMCIEYHI